MIEGFSKIVERSMSRIDIGHSCSSALLILGDRLGKVKTISKILQHLGTQVNPQQPTPSTNLLNNQPPNPLNNQPPNPLNDQTTNLLNDQTTNLLNNLPTNLLNDQTTNLLNNLPTNPLNDQTTYPLNDQTTNPLNDQTTQLAKDGSQVGNRINNGRKKEEVIIEEYPEIDLVEIVEQMIQKRILPPRLRTQHCCCIVKAFAQYFNSNVYGKLTLFSRLLKEGLKDAVACGVRALQKCFSDFGFFGHQKTEVNDCWEKHRQEKYDGMNRLINTIKAFLSENMSFVMP